MTTTTTGLRATRGVVGCVVGLLALVGCTEAGPRLQLQVPRAPRNAAALNPMATSVPGTATFDAPLIAPATWSGAPVGTGTFSITTSPAVSGGPSSIALTDPQSSDRYVLIGDFSASTGRALALISDTRWTVGTNTLNGLGRTAVLFDVSTGTVTDIARSGVVTLTAAGTAVGQRVTGSLSASFVPASTVTPGCVVDADCGSSQVCRSGACVPAPTGCTSNAQCAAGQVCQAGACVAAPMGCTSNAQCAAGQVCQAGACVAVSVADAGACVVDTDCARGEWCVSGQCVVAPTGCTSNAQCAAGQVCQAGLCVAAPMGCTSNAQCAAGQVCQAGACVAAPMGCTSSAQCLPGESCISGQCVSAPGGCTSSAQCPRGQTCQANVCVPPAPASCVGQQGTGQYSGSAGAVATCSAIGSGPLSLSGAIAAIDQDQGQLALFIVDPATQRDGLVVALSACPSMPGTVTAPATLYTSTQVGAVQLSAMVPGTATVQWTQVGFTTTGTVSVALSNGGAVTGSFTVQ
jgi:Cys-rich repeat protein